MSYRGSLQERSAVGYRYGESRSESQHERSAVGYRYGESRSESKSSLAIIRDFLGMGKKKITEEFITALSDVTNEMDRLNFELKQEKEQNEISQDRQFELEKKVIQAEGEIVTLRSKIRSLEEGKVRVDSKERDLNRQIEDLQKQVESKEHDLSKNTREIDLLNYQLKEKGDRIAQEMRKVKDADTMISQLSQEKKRFQDEMDEIRRQRDQEADRYSSQKTEMMTQFKQLQGHVDDKQREVCALVHTSQTAEREMQKLKDQNERLKTELEEMRKNETELRHKIACVEEEQERLKRQNGDKAERFQKDMEEQKSLSMKEAEVLNSQVRDLDRTMREAKQKIERLTNDNERIQKENEHLKQQRSVLEVQDSSSKKSSAELQAKLAALQASSDTREQFLQKEIERLTRQHNADLRKQHERHTAEKEEMQTQIEKFFQVLNDEKKVERETLRSTIQQVAHTHSITNHILQAAFRACQGRQQQQHQRWSAANIREMDDDL